MSNTIKLSGKAEEIASVRYYKDDERSWEDVATRVGTFVANGGQDAEGFSEAIATGLFIPGGRILRNAGRQRGSLFNCYHLPIGDSRLEIGECFKNSLVVWGEGGGVGINFSSLRPKGAPIRGVGGSSSGLVSFMQALDGIAATVESGGQRRAASLGLCEVWHPILLRLNWMNTRSITLISASGSTTTLYKLYTNRARGPYISIDKTTVQLTLQHCGGELLKTSCTMANRAF